VALAVLLGEYGACVADFVDFSGLPGHPCHYASQTALAVSDRARCSDRLAAESAIAHAAFLRHVGAVARRLPPARFIFNLCEDRYLFLVAFAAVGANGQTGLLPPAVPTCICGI
jgi:hypothetical protein